MSTRYRRSFFDRIVDRVGFSTMCLVIGLGLATFAGYSYQGTTRFLAGAEETTGTVVSLVDKTTQDGDGTLSTSWYPVVRLTVAYQPEEPSDAKIVSFRQLYFVPLLFGVAGAALFTGGAIARIVGWRRALRRR